MNEFFNQFGTFLAKIGYTQFDIETLISKCEIIEFKKGDFVFRAGVKQDKVYFICKGIIRNIVITDKGEIKTYSFRMENMTSTGYANYNYAEDLKAKTSVECLEDCIMIKVPKEAIEYMLKNCLNGERVGRLLAERHVIELVDFIIENDTMTLLERYNRLDLKFPNIHQRVPQHIIASYLRTTPVHLSRVKNAKYNS